MKTMILSDFLIMRKYLLQQALLSLVVAVFVGVATEMSYVAIATVGIMVPFALALTLLALDERGGWERFRLALPLSRTGVVAGRYVTLLLLTLAGTAFGLVCAFLLSAGSAAVMDESLFQEMLWQLCVLVASLSASITLVVMAIILPLVARFGMTKAIRFAPVVLFLGVFFAFQLLGEQLGGIPFAESMASWLLMPGGSLTASALVAAVALALYALSCGVAVKLYAHREF